MSSLSSSLRRSVVTAIAAAAMGLTTVLASAPAYAAPPDPGTSSSTPTADATSLDAVIESATRFWTEYGVGVAQQQALVAGIESGVAPASTTGAQPVSSEVEAADGFDVTIDTYADGSVAVSRVQQPVAPAPGSVAPLGVSGCSASSSGANHYRSNCVVDRWDGIVSQSFRADFVFVDYGYDRISAVYSPSTTVIGSSATTQTSFGIVKATENAAGPARAELVASATLPWGTHNYGLGLRVGASIGGQSYSWSG